MSYLFPVHREPELGPDREPMAWSSWPEHAIVGDRVELRARGAAYRVGDQVTGPRGELARVVETHPGGAMFRGSATLEVVALPLRGRLEPYPRSRVSDLGQ